MSSLSPDEQRAMFNAIMGGRPSRSPLRHLGEGNIGNAEDVDFAIDGNVHIIVMYLLAKLGEPNTLAMLQDLAAADPGRYPDRQNDALLAQAILADIQSQPAVAPSNSNVAGAPAVVQYDTPVVPVNPAPIAPIAPDHPAVGQLANIHSQLDSVSDYLNKFIAQLKELK